MTPIRFVRASLLGGTLVAAACSTRASDMAFSESAISTTSWAIVDAENRRDPDAAALRAALTDPSSEVAQRALLAYGRIGGDEVVPVIVPFLASEEPAIRTRAAYALSVAGSDATHPGVAAPARDAVRDRLSAETEPSVRGALFIALGFLGDATTAAIFASALTGDHAESAVVTRAAAASGLATFLARVHGVTLGPDVWAALLTIATPAADGSEDAARALGYFPGGPAEAVPTLLDLVHAKIAANDVQTAGWLARAIGVIRSPSSESALAGLVTDASIPDRVAAYAAQGLAKQGASTVTLDGLRAALRSPSPKVAREVLTDLPTMADSAAPLAPDLTRLFDAEGAPSELVAGALTVLAGLDPAAARTRAGASLAPTKSALLRDTAIGVLKTVDPAKLPPLCDAADTHTALLALDTLTSLGLDALKGAFGPDVATTLLLPLLQKAIDRHDEYGISIVASTLNELGLPDLLDQVVAELPRYSRTEQLWARDAIVHAISEGSATRHLPVLQALLHDPTRTVALDAAAAIQKMTGADVTAQATARSQPSFATPSPEQIDAALRTRVVFTTAHGTITFRMLADAPLTATKFVELASRGFYDGNPVHRVVSNWVAQGGAPTDDTGHVDFLVPDEATPTGHGFGYVGLATAGKDTGSGQYFVDLAANHRLDATYTSFAVVESGMDAALLLEQGELVTSVQVVP
jgi:cyclophilin family peptidyl-prolyl cis-trans isomerase/HEAT repeat protein